MKIAITDACILIDICELEIAIPFFGLSLEIHTTIDVFNELYDAQQALLNPFLETGKLTLHSIDETARKEMAAKGYPRALSDNDKTVLYIAEKIGAMVLSSDKPVRNYAKKLCIEYHGMLWIFDQLLTAGLLGYQAGCERLQQLVAGNIIYQNNTELAGEISKRLAAWKGKQ